MSGSRKTIRFTPEERLLLAISSPFREDGAVNAAFADCRDWNDLLRLAQLHNLLPQLALVAGPPENSALVPANEAGQLEQIRLRAFMLDRMQVLSLGEILQCYAGEGIPSMLLKGHGLAERLYEDPCERISTDIDLVLPAEWREAAEDSMRTLGYQPIESEFYDETHFHTPWVNPQRKLSCTIELHWELSPASSPIQFKVGGWWDGAREFQSRSGSVLIPSPDHELAHLVWHTFNKGTATLRDLSDLARLWCRVSKAGTQQEIVNCCNSTGTTIFLHQALRLCRRFWGLEIDPAIAQGNPASLRDWLAGWSFSPGEVLAAGKERTAAQRKIGYWSLLPPELAPWSFLISDTLQEVDDSARLLGQTPELRESFSLLVSLLAEFKKSFTAHSTGRERSGSRD